MNNKVYGRVMLTVIKSPPNTACTGRWLPPPPTAPPPNTTVKVWMGRRNQWSYLEEEELRLRVFCFQAESMVRNGGGQR